MLDNIEKKNPFKTPENYFERFNADIMSSLPQENKAKVVPLWKPIAKWASIAAVMTGVAVIGANFLDSNEKTDRNQSVTNTSYSIEDDYYAFIEEEATQSLYRDAIFAEN